MAFLSSSSRWRTALSTLALLAGIATLIYLLRHPRDSAGSTPDISLVDVAAGIKVLSNPAPRSDVRPSARPTSTDRPPTGPKRGLDPSLSERQNRPRPVRAAQARNALPSPSADGEQR